jgi:AcrR family transcriptional regulator
MTYGFKGGIEMNGRLGQARQMTRKQRERATRRKEIIDAAEHLFASKGFENTTMDEIAERAEFGKPTLYSYFKGKEEILFRVHMRKHSDKIAVFREAVDKEVSGYDKLRALGVAYHKFYSENPTYLAMQVYWDYRGRAFETYGETVSDRAVELAETFRELSQILKTGIEDGSLRNDLDIDRTMELFFMTLRTVLNQVLLVRPPNVSQLEYTTDDTYFYYLDLFLEGVKART